MPIAIRTDGKVIVAQREEHARASAEPRPEDGGEQNLWTPTEGQIAAMRAALAKWRSHEAGARIAGTHVINSGNTHLHGGVISTQETRGELARFGSTSVEYLRQLEQRARRAEAELAQLKQRDKPEGSRQLKARQGELELTLTVVGQLATVQVRRVADDELIESYSIHHDVGYVHYRCVDREARADGDAEYAAMVATYRALPAAQAGVSPAPDWLIAARRGFAGRSAPEWGAALAAAGGEDAP